MDNWTREDVDTTYNISGWGNGYFFVNEKGNLSVDPKRDGKSHIDFTEVIEEIKDMGVNFPVVIRFQDVLRSQVIRLNETFKNTIAEANYHGEYMGVYPIKVNQLREVVEEIVDAGKDYKYGLEAGSKSELIAVLAMNTNPGAPTILNGYKDHECMKLAMIATQLGRKMIVVIEKISELNTLIEAYRETGICPYIGFRTKMLSKTTGHWSHSGGEKAKFGLTMAEVLTATEMLKKEGIDDRLILVHFHVGSQLNDIRSVKEAVTEGTRIYALLKKRGFPSLNQIDVGGGLAVDYDGSQSSRSSSRNYSIEEYVSDIVYGVQQVCQLEGVDEPNITTESGRAITAYHSCIVTKVIGENKPYIKDFDTSVTDGEHVFVKNMRDILADVSADNLQESFNDVKAQKESALAAFKLGIISLDEQAKIETLYWNVIEKLYGFIQNMDIDDVPEDLEEINDKFSSQYLCNFSVFQSIADTWAIDQILPVMPISRLNERPTKSCVLLDITCDSDGKIDKFVGTYEDNKTIPLHKLNNDDYYIGIFLTGAYQDVMGDQHNLFGRVNEVHVFVDDTEPTGFFIEESIKGDSAGKILKTMQYNPEQMAYNVKSEIDKVVRSGKLHAKNGVKMVDFYENCLEGYTYLKSNKKL